MRKTLLTLSTIVGANLLAGCATIISGTSQALHVQAVDAQTHQSIPGATCSVMTSTGLKIPLPSNPGVVNVARGKGPLQVTCQEQSYKQSQMGVGDSFNVWTIADVLFWPGFIVDGLDGAYSKYDQSYVTVLMNKNGANYQPAKVGTKQQK